jgi:D-aminoacyl-tRNA deacylase
VKVVLQRVSRAAVRVEGKTVGEIGPGLVVLAGFTRGDTPETIEWMAEKIVGLRIFGDAERKMNLALGEVGGALLVISQFTLYGDARKGRRPSFVDAAPPEIATPLYESLVARLREKGARVETGVFGAMMEVELVNDGPVTLLLGR